MIHINIPTVSEKFERLDGKRFHVYDIHLNGAFHAQARYSALYAIHEKLLETFGLRLGNVEFPPKKFWHMDIEAINQRREALTKYFHGVIQNTDLHLLLERLFLKLQVAFFGAIVSEVKLEIFIPDGQKVIINCQSDDDSEVVMKTFACSYGIEQHNVSHFGLFLCRDRFKEEGCVDGKPVFDQMCVRWLKNFESPHISLQLMNKAGEDSQIIYRLCVRKTIWDPIVEEPLLDCPASLKLIYLQTLIDIQRDVFRIGKDAKTKLAAFQEQGLFKQFMHLCHLQASYGFELLSPAKCNYNDEDCIMNVKVGRRQLLFEYRQNGVLSQLIIKSTRIRIWRVSQNETEAQMMFQIDYLVNKDEFNQLTFYTNQAVLLSLFLQSIAAEILRDLGRTSPGTYKFNDELQSKVIENLEASRTKSIISDDYLILDSSNGDSENGSCYSLDTPLSLFKVISHQMPFDNENFSEITDADL